MHEASEAARPPRQAAILAAAVKGFLPVRIPTLSQPVSAGRRCCLHFDPGQAG